MYVFRCIVSKNAAKVLLFFDINKKKSAETLFFFLFVHSLIPEL